MKDFSCSRGTESTRRRYVYRRAAAYIQIQRVFDIANWMMLGDAMTDEDKEEYKWDRENGDWMGYKSPKGWGEVRHLTVPANVFSKDERPTTALKLTTCTERVGNRTDYLHGSDHLQTKSLPMRM